MMILDKIRYKTIKIQKEDLQNCLIQMHLQIRFKLGTIFKLEVWRLVEICQALQTKKLSQGVDFNMILYYSNISSSWTTTINT